MKKLRDLTSPIYKFDHGQRKHVPYLDMQEHLKELDERRIKAEETATMWRKKYRLLCLQVATVDELLNGKNEHMEPIQNDPDWKLLLKFADFGSAAMEPVSQDYDAMRDLENTTGNGELPFVV